jgi:hypothetical protein
MKKTSRIAAVVAALTMAPLAEATTSTTFWTPATTYTQPYLVPHLTMDTYFGERGEPQLFTGLTIGVLPFEKVRAEVGFDLLYPGKTSDGLALNGRVSLPEGAFGAFVPGLSAGIQGVGFEKDISDLNMLHGAVSMTFPYVGTLSAGGYYAMNERLLVNELGTPVDRSGLMASWVSPELKIGKPALEKVVLMADVMTGKHAFGAVGAGVGVYFTDSIALLTGPVFFLNRDLARNEFGQSTLWSMQIDVDLDLFAR